MPASPWSDWQPLALSAPPRDARVLAELLDGGQAFRWQCRSSPASPDPAFHVMREKPSGKTPRGTVPAETWLGVWAGCVAEVGLAPGALHRGSQGGR